MTDVAAPPTEHAPSEPGRRWPRRLRRWLAWFVAGAAALVLIAAAVTAALDARDARRFAAPGDLVELPDGRMLHLQVAGEQHDGPTVVLDAGAGGFSPLLAWLQADLADQATVVAYDRPGYGWSSPADRPVDAAATAADLHQALNARGLPGPYVLVGHSLGAFYVRAFADHYPQDVAALVLLDPVHEHQLDHLPAETVTDIEQMNQALTWAARLARLGIFRLHNPNDAAAADLPEQAVAQVSALTATAAYWHASAAEAKAFTDLAAAVTPDFGDLPVLIISATHAAPSEQDLRAVMDTLHPELARRSPHATQHAVDDAEHLTLLTNPQHARTTARLITELLHDLANTLSLPPSNS